MKFPNVFRLVPALVLCSASALAQAPSAPITPAGKAGMDNMSGMSMTDSDKDFATMMKMHHQKALEMARKELANGKSPEMKAMAQKIIDGQTKEIAELDKWLTSHN